MAYALQPPLKAYANLNNRARGLIFGLSFSLLLYLMSVRKKGSGQTVHMPSLLADVMSTEILCAGQYFYVHNRLFLKLQTICLYPNRAVPQGTV